MFLRGNRFVNDERCMIADEFAIAVNLTASDAAGGVVSLLNPFGVDVIVTDAILHVTTAATAACTVDIGIAANGSTSSDKLIDGMDVNAAAGVFDNRIDKGTNGGMYVWEDDQYLTASKASGSTAGLVGILYAKCVQKL